jgi:hypothetical protein
MVARLSMGLDCSGGIGDGSEGVSREIENGESVAKMVRKIGMSNRIQPEYRVSHQISTVDEQGPRMERTAY